MKINMHVKRKFYIMAIHIYFCTCTDTYSPWQCLCNADFFLVIWGGGRCANAAISWIDPALQEE